MNHKMMVDQITDELARVVSKGPKAWGLKRDGTWDAGPELQKVFRENVMRILKANDPLPYAAVLDEYLQQFETSADNRMVEVAAVETLVNFLQQLQGPLNDVVDDINCSEKLENLSEQLRSFIHRREMLPMLEYNPNQET